MSSPKERLIRVAESLLQQAPGMVQVMLSNYCRLWVEQLDDEQVLDICRQIKTVLAYVETGPDKNDENDPVPDGRGTPEITI